jgi:hypothetical protein
MTKASNEKITRQPGYLYYLGGDGYVWASPMKSNKNGKKHRAGTEKITRVKGALYYLGKDGYVGMNKR